MLYIYIYIYIYELLGLYFVVGEKNPIRSSYELKVTPPDIFCLTNTSQA